ncbi:MAG: 50S ribosome-binding GTPase [Akkermansia sp.]|nr:50S ribosome-binding GTPase [Akkermansia sp.]
MNTKRTIALAGNPNSGKTSLFNELTGANQYVGNWPGVTVERKGGRLKEHEEIEVLDLPGIYSLSPYSPEEMVTRHYLLEKQPDMVINVVDATNLERNLYLTSQLAEIGIPMVVALNMIDLAEQRGDKIDTEVLSKALGCPVIKISALHQTGTDALVEQILSDKEIFPHPLAFSPAVESAICALKEKQQCSRWEAIKLLEDDAEIIAGKSPQEKHEIAEVRLNLEKEMDDDIASIIAAGRYDAITAIIPQAVTKGKEGNSFSNKLDAILTHRVAGLAIFVAVMWAIYHISISTIGDWGTAWANDVLFGEVVPAWLGGFIGNTPADMNSMVMLSTVLALCFIFPITLRRLHDLGLNGLWVYLIIAPFVLEYMCPHLPGMAHTVLMVVLLGVNVLLQLACICLPGHKSTNKYGSQPTRFSFNPFKLDGRTNRASYIAWYIILSLLCVGIGALGTVTLDCSHTLSALISNGIVAGVGAVLGFVPQMAVLFLLLALLEDCGYMARVAFMMDRIFRTIGLSGKSFIPLLVAMGCGVPAVMATRTIENEKDRRMSVILTTFIPCGAKLPIIALFAALVGEDANIATIAYFAGIGSVIVGGYILRKTHMFAGSYTPFVMELPAYHTPRAANINMRAMERCKAFVRKAGTVIFLACAFIWFSSNYNWKMEYLNTDEDASAIDKSMLASIGNSFAPLFTPLGWGDWKPAVATVTGLVAKENVVGTFGVLYAPAAGTEEEEAPEEAAEEMSTANLLPMLSACSDATVGIWDAMSSTGSEYAMPEGSGDEEEEEEEGEEAGVAVNIKEAGAFTTISALSFMLFNLLCAPCFAACGAIRNEMHSARWTWFAIGYMCLWAYMVSFLTYQFGMWMTTGSFASGQVIACLVAAALLYMIARRGHSQAN